MSSIEAQIAASPSVTLQGQGEEAIHVPWVIPSPPYIEDKSERRKFLKERLALAFRIFAKLGFDEGVAGHITVKVINPSPFFYHTLANKPRFEGSY